MNKLKAYYRDLARHLAEVWIEVRPNKGRVAWPALDNVKISTKIVIVSSIGIGVLIGILDWAFSWVLIQVVGG
jgi:preprotein translocase SecE subunit